MVHPATIDYASLYYSLLPIPVYSENPETLGKYFKCIKSLLLVLLLCVYKFVDQNLVPFMYLRYFVLFTYMIWSQVKSKCIT